MICVAALAMTANEQKVAVRLRVVFARIALAAAVLTFVVIVASAFMRHTQAGLACDDWPACYGRMESADAAAVPPSGVRIARIAHRLAATSVLALVIGMLLVAWTQRPAWKREGGLALAALAVAAALAVLGLATPGSKIPAVTLGNLLGGYLMLALLAATAAAAAPGHDREAYPRASTKHLRRSAMVVLALVFAQAAAGGMIGAQFALTACPALEACPAFSVAELRAAGALDPFRVLSIADGRVVPPLSAAGLHVVHRGLGIVTAIATIVLAYRLRRFDRRSTLMLAALALGSVLLGAAAILGMPSLLVTVLHNAFAAMLIAALAALTARTAESAPAIQNGSVGMGGGLSGGT